MTESTNHGMSEVQTQLVSIADIPSGNAFNGLDSTQGFDRPDAVAQSQGQPPATNRLAEPGARLYGHGSPFRHPIRVGSCGPRARLYVISSQTPRRDD
jgi:hypothetical protein